MMRPVVLAAIVGSIAQRCKKLSQLGPVRRLLLVGIFGLLVSCLLLGVAVWQPAEQPSLVEAQARWEAQAASDYRIALLVEYQGEHCMQNIEVRGGQAQRIIQDTCDVPWLTGLTVPRLFDLSERIEEIPASRCHPSSLACACHRVFTTRRLSYDQELGYPDRIMTRSEIRPNWGHSDYWKQVLETRVLPSCSGQHRKLTIEILSLTALD